MSRVTIDPITRLEGHGKIEIFLNDEGNVDNAYIQIPEFRGFERFCMGRPAEELPRITPRICGVCPTAHHMASTKTLDAAFNVEPPSAAKKLRELIYSGYFVYDHTLHFYYLGGPDFIVGPQAPATERNILGVIAKVGLEIAKEVIKHRSYGQKVIQILGGKATHPVCGLPGGVSKALTEEERKEIEEMAKSSVKFAQFSLETFDKLVLQNKEYLDLILSDAYTMKTYYMGLVDDNNKVNFYDGKVRVVDPNGKEYVKFAPKDYLTHIAEHVEPWSYIKFPYLKGVGWKGFVDGVDSGVYRVAPLARLNASDGMATPLAQEAYEKMMETLGYPAHQTLATHWARLIELQYAAERLLELSQDEEITSTDIRAQPGEPGEGVGIVEACRGTLVHHYKLNEEGLAEKVNLIVATVNNAPAISMSVRDAAKGVIKNGEVSEGLLNMVEMAFRAYDPCFACATHFMPGEMPLEVRIHRTDGTIQSVKRSF
ncbi:MAG: Ni/Fe hydrogenase subunit alpha [Theionarchaea archaeon]|nr:MAG: F420-nonreducing hydrogenase [Theionarchaea archaeon DG-70-1]MBU7030137.1 Ni/Fe hydrogenase subunit alpha [Theionarchaea archaeon]